MNTTLLNKLYILILLSLFCINKALCNNKADSLLKVISLSKNDSVISKCYYQLADITFSSNPKKGLVYINKSILYFKKYSSNFQYENFLRKSIIHRIIGDLDSSIYYTNKLYSNALKNNIGNYIAESYSEYGLISVSQNNFQKGIEYFIKQTKAIKKYNLVNKIAGVYNNLGIAYGNKGDWAMAKEYFTKALNDNKKNKRIEALGGGYNNLGIIFIINHQLDSAKKYLLEGLNYRSQSNDSIGICGSLNNLALLENENSNFKKALSIADSAFKIASSNSYKKQQVEIYDSYDQIYSKMGNYKMAYEFVNKKNQLNSFFEKEKFTNDIQELENNIQLEQKQTQLLEKDLILAKSEQQKQKQLAVIVIASILIIALIIFLYYFFKNNKTLTTQNLVINHQKLQIEEKHKDITDSITYAHRIQSSLIPSQETLNKECGKIAILFQPRDIVSGDFYWYAKVNTTHIFALADCTGHGVPGAFMSFIGINQLNTIVNEKGILKPQHILNELKKGVIKSLNSNNAHAEKKDGMDVALIAFNEKELTFSGANQSALIIRNNELIEMKGNRQPIGLSDNNEGFIEITHSLLTGDRIALYSDGLVDQFGGIDGKKLKTKNLKLWLQETTHLSYTQQVNTITTKINDYKGVYEQTDDITLAIIEI